MFNIKRIESWREGFGLFPISIKPTTPNKYALLNGGVKDFCVDLAPDGNVDLFNSYAWSANTKNYLTVDGGYVKIYNWLKPESKPEKIKID
ncbi:MAG: hypothetical protein LUD72_12995, partial [Bacteroidales bacterium]|nr:hypothetical protein [Bacteroidales bacterium]